MKRLLLATSALIVLTGAALADTIVDDPLHDDDIINGVNTNTDNGTISPLKGGDPFGFFISPGNQTGDFKIVVLVPTNETFNATGLAVTGTFSSSAAVSNGVWSSGTLEGFLGLPSGSPNNPIGAFTSADTADAAGTPTGFKVFTLDVGSNDNLQDFALSTDHESISGLPIGALITGFLVEGNNTVDTASSGVLEVTSLAAAVPEPATWAMLILGFIGVGGISTLRSRRGVPSFRIV